MSASGLEGIVATKSAITLVEGEAGRLSFRGYNIHALAMESTYEETAYLLWHGKLPDQKQLAALHADLSAHRALSPELTAILQALPVQSTHPMAFLRTATSMLAHFDSEGENSSRESNYRKAIHLTARLPTIMAVFDRTRCGQPLVAPRSDLGQAANFLYMLKGEDPDPLHSRMLDIYFVLLADHELNPSTFAARTTAATLSDLYSAVTSGVSALKGSLHGGANEKTMEMLLKIGDPGEAEAYVGSALQRKERIMGFGHRVYKTEDPRATHLRQMAEELGKSVGDTRWFEISKRIEDFMMREKGLNANVDFYSASVMYLCGIPIDLFTPVFACSRIAGWTAHVLEQLADNRLIRPRAEYIGPRDLPYVPVDRR